MTPDEAPQVSARTLIVNADDFGMSDGVNEGIVSAFTHGIVRSTSLMVRMPAAESAAALAAEEAARRSNRTRQPG